jgi:aminoglycoside phosphotransferase family enzyme
MKIDLKNSKMLPHGNTSFFFVSAKQISCMLIANNNMYIINQRMKMYFVDFYFPSKDHIICNYGQMQLVQHE